MCVVGGVIGELAVMGSKIFGTPFTSVMKMTSTPVMGIIFKTEIEVSGLSSADNKGVLFFQKREATATIWISRTGNVS